MIALRCPIRHSPRTLDARAGDRGDFLYSIGSEPSKLARTLLYGTEIDEQIPPRSLTQPKR